MFRSLYILSWSTVLSMKMLRRLSPIFRVSILTSFPSSVALRMLPSSNVLARFSPASRTVEDSTA